jgi:hypothetical protein
MPQKMDSQDWLRRADEARALAHGMKDPDSRTAMFRIAADYEKLAARAVAREVIQRTKAQQSGS